MRHAERPSQRVRNGGERLALSQQVRPADMGGEVFVAEVEPAVRAVSVQPFQRVESLARDAPARLRVGQAGERVHHRVHIGRHMKAVKLLVVARIDHDGKVGRRQNPGQPKRQLSAAHAARKREIVHEAHSLSGDTRIALVDSSMLIRILPSVSDLSPILSTFLRRFLACAVL